MADKSEVSGKLARSLTKKRLAAVIFGCKRHTFQECIDKKLFGLPASHISYVKNVTPGLTLFLFNYSDRRLHGVFEAVTEGQLKIDQYAWIASEGAKITPYAAQVRIKEKMKCRPLLEAEFKPLIAKNYYSDNLFSFELDKGQTEILIALFLSLPMPKKMPRFPVALRQNNAFDVLSSSHVDKAKEASDQGFNNLNSHEYQEMAEVKLDENAQSYASVIVNKDAFAPEKKWTDLFKASSTSHSGQNGEGLVSREVNFDSSECSVMEWKFASTSHNMSKLSPEACPDAATTGSHSYAVLFDDYAREIYENTCLRSHDRAKNRPELTDVSSAEGRTVTDGESGETVTNAGEILRSSNVLVSNVNCQMDHSNKENNMATSRRVFTNVGSSDSECLINQLIEEIEGLMASHSKQRLKIDSLEHELVKSKLEVDELKLHCRKLESLTSSGYYPCDVEKSVLIVGGYNGHSWLSDLTSYSPLQDHVVSLCPMTSSRSYASVAKLNGEMYIFGGFLDDVWYDTVESYNPASDQWLQRPSLNKKKGSLAGASIYEKIFAIGGGDGVYCFSEVEYFDLNIGTWIFTQSMLEKRFALSASEMNGAIYVSGGYDGKDYLSSVERFDPRLHAWTKLASMNSRRGCHSLVAYNEKLYAIGGYDGDAVVSTVEVLDPRFGSWMMEKPMTVSRTHFGSFVIGGKLYIVGGLEDNTQASSVVECYDEISGWEQVAGMTALGKRCFFSTLVL